MVSKQGRKVILLNPIFDESDFYNALRKIEFLNSKLGAITEQSVMPYSRLFKAIREDEKKYQNDICDFSYDALMDTMSLRFSKGFRSKSVQLSLLGEYIDWCIANRLKKTDENPIRLIKSTDIDTSVQIRKQLLRDPEQLYSILDTILPSEKDDCPTIDIMYRLLCLLIYEGFTENEALLIKKTDVNFEDGTIISGGKTITMSDRLIAIVKQVYDLEVIYKNIHSGALAAIKLDDGDNLFRITHYANKTDRIQMNLRFRLSKLRKDYGNETYEIISLSPNRLLLSGIYYRLYNKEKDGHKLKNEDFIFDDTKLKNKNQIYTHTYINKIEYAQWKKAFKL